MNNIKKGLPQFAALVGNDVVGWCDVIPKARPVHALSGILGIGLLPDWRGQGHWRALISKSLNAARQLGLTRIESTVNADNVRAIGLHRSVGFQQGGTLKDAFLIDGIYRDLLLMGLVERTDCARAVIG